MSQTSQSESLQPLAGALMPATLLSRRGSWHPSFHDERSTHIRGGQDLAAMCGGQRETEGQHIY